MKFILYAFRVTIGTYTVLNRSNWTGISTRFNMELVVTSTKACKNVSMANISNIRNISFVSKYKLKFSICPKFENHWRELFSNVLNDNAAMLSAEDKFVWILSNEDPSCVRELATFIHSCFQWDHSSLHACFIFYLFQIQLSLFHCLPMQTITQTITYNFICYFIMSFFFHVLSHNLCQP